MQERESVWMGLWSVAWEFIQLMALVLIIGVVYVLAVQGWTWLNTIA